ncbi:MAG: hypothetical protein JNM63_19485, partial [Spirochaetia bacterium]|nr:hypothetical protein [Spirochaetia bacterium]
MDDSRDWRALKLEIRMWEIISKIFSRFIRNRRETLLLSIAVLFLSLYLFKVIGGGRPDASKLGKNSNLTSKDDASKDGATIWTCAMHPQIRLPAPGKCPICAMDLIPLTGHAHELTDSQIVLSEVAQQTARVRTVPVVRRMARKEIRLPGRVETIPGKESRVLSPASGVVSRVTVTLAGTLVRPGDPLVEIKESTGTLRQVLASS